MRYLFCSDYYVLIDWCISGEADGPAVVTVLSNGDYQGDGLRTALVVDRRVRHLETQLYVNRRRRAFLARFFGLDDDDDDAESRTHGHRARSALLHPGNEYFDERCRLRMLHAGVDLPVPLPSSSLLEHHSVESLTETPHRGYDQPATAAEST